MGPDALMAALAVLVEVAGGCLREEIQQSSKYYIPILHTVEFTNALVGIEYFCHWLGIYFVVIAVLLYCILCAIGR